jgi:hypothetical protein
MKFYTVLFQEEIMQHQSGERSGEVKKEGLKTTNTTEKNENKNTKSFQGGDNGALSDDDLDRDGIQQAGGNNNGGEVPGAFGNNDKADGHTSLNEGM